VNIKAYRPFGFSFAAAAFILGVVTLLSGCGSGSGAPASSSAVTTSALAVSPASPAGTTGQTLVFVITGGSPGYSATSSNESIATLTQPVLNNGVYIFTAKLNSAGAVTLTVVDSKSATVPVAITVTTSAAASLITSAPKSVTIGIGAAYKQSYTIGGGTLPYTATSANTNVATAMPDPLNPSKVIITGVAAGTADVFVTDAAGTSSVTITVNVAAVTGTGFSVTGDTTWTWTGACPVGVVPPYAVFYINGGIPPYTVSPTIPQVGTVMLTAPTAAVTVSATPVTIGTTGGPIGGSFAVAWPNSPTCFGSGIATFNVQDSTGAVVSTAPKFTITWTP
jgi:hypothetical protein